MMPFSGYARTSRDIDDGLRHGLQEWVNAAVTNDIVGGNIRDGLFHIVMIGGNFVIRM